MDQSEVKRIVGKHMRPMLRFLSVAEWTIDVRHGHIDMGDPGIGIKATCLRRVSYKRAMIEIDHDQIEDENDLIDILFHEICHIVHAPFDLYYEAAADAYGYGADDSPLLTSLRRVYSHACEEFVNVMLFSWRGSGWRELYLKSLPSPAPETTHHE